LLAIYESITAVVCRDCLFVEVIQSNVSATVEVEAKLSNLPVILNVGKYLTLGGVIGFFGGKNVKSVGYYVAFCRRNDATWQTFDDLNNSSAKCRGNLEVRINLSLYTT
jgi:hypothetical protein